MQQDVQRPMVVACLHRLQEAGSKILAGVRGCQLNAPWCAERSRSHCGGHHEETRTGDHGCWGCLQRRASRYGLCSGRPLEVRSDRAVVKDSVIPNCVLVEAARSGSEGNNPSVEDELPLALEKANAGTHRNSDQVRRVQHSRTVQHTIHTCPLRRLKASCLALRQRACGAQMPTRS